jgi:hypothetical protein
VGRRSVNFAAHAAYNRVNVAGFGSPSFKTAEYAANIEISAAGFGRPSFKPAEYAAYTEVSASVSGNPADQAAYVEEKVPDFRKIEPYIRPYFSCELDKGLCFFRNKFARFPTENGYIHGVPVKRFACFLKKYRQIVGKAKPFNMLNESL